MNADGLSAFGADGLFVHRQPSTFGTDGKESFIASKEILIRGCLFLVRIFDW